MKRLNLGVVDMKYRLWLRKKLNTILGPIRRHSLNRTDFTIISNNCWGG